MNDGSAAWIKIVTRIFEDAKIVALGELPDGDSLLVCWFRLLCLAGEQNRDGSIYLTESVAFTPGILAAKWRCKASIVQMALTAFQKFGMISIDQEGTIWVLNWSKYQNEEGLAKIRERDLKRLDDRADAQNANERTARKRASDAERQRRCRRNKAVTPDVTRDSHATVTPRSHPVTLPVTLPVTHLTNGNSGSYDDVTPCHAPKIENKNKSSLSLTRACAREGVESIQKEDIIQHAEAKRILGQLSEEVFGKPLRATQWPNDLEHLLDAALPMERQDLELLRWFYTQPANHAIFKITMRRQSMRALIENLESEIQKVKSVVKSLPKKTAAAAEIDEEAEEYDERQGWTNERVAATRELFPRVNEDLFERPYEHVAGDIRVQIESQVKKWGGQNG